MRVTARDRRTTLRGVTLVAMTYRDDRDADRARIDALETELAVARKKIDELENHREQALVLASPGGALATRQTAGQKWLGAPLRLELAHTFEGELPADQFESLIPIIRTITGDAGRTELLRTWFTWSSSGGANSAGPFVTVMISIKEGRTTLAVTDRLGQLAGTLYGGFGGGIGGGAIVAPIMASLAVPLLAPVFFAGWFGGVYATTRWLFKRSARRRAESVQRVFDALVAEIEQQLKPPADRR